MINRPTIGIPYSTPKYHHKSMFTKLGLTFTKIKNVTILIKYIYIKVVT